MNSKQTQRVDYNPHKMMAEISTLCDSELVEHGKRVLAKRTLFTQKISKEQKTRCMAIMSDIGKAIHVLTYDAQGRTTPVYEKNMARARAFLATIVKELPPELFPLSGLAE